MKTVNLPDGGVKVEPETDEEKRIHEAGVEACLKAVHEEMDNIDEHRAIGMDPGDFRDLGPEEAYDAIEKEGNTNDDAINAVATDERVEAAVNRFLEELVRQIRKA